MKKVTVNRFDGGEAEDIRTTNTNENQYSYNFDIYTNPHKLIPIRDNVEGTYANKGEFVDATHVQMSDVVTQVVSGSTRIVTQGKHITDGSIDGGFTTAPEFFYNSSMNGDWASGTTGTGVKTDDTMVSYNEKAYLVSKSTNDYLLVEYTSVGTATTRVTLTPATISYGSYPVPKPVVHPEDHILYYVVGNAIGRWDGVGLSPDTSTTILPADMVATSITPYGAYLAIAMRPLHKMGDSIVFLWGRDMSLNTTQGQINFGRGDLNVLENINETLVGILSPNTAVTSSIDNRIDIKIYEGGGVRTLRSYNATNKTLTTTKSSTSEKLYFSLAGDELALRVIYKNKLGDWVVTTERYLYNGSTTATDLIDSVTSISFIGDYSFVSCVDGNGTYHHRATEDEANYTFTSKYRTTINPNMDIQDRYTEKQLVGIQVFYTGTAGTNSLVVKYAVDGGSDVTAISLSNVSGEGFFETGDANATAEFVAGREYEFEIQSTGGIEVKQVVYFYENVPSSIQP